MSEVTTERVLVVPTELFHGLGHFQGFSPEVDRYLGELLKPSNTSYRPRDEVENDPGFKQLIPYVIFCHRDAEGRQQVFQYTRGTGQGEGRLHRKHSVGIGGHHVVGVRPVDHRGEARRRVDARRLVGRGRDDRDRALLANDSPTAVIDQDGDLVGAHLSGRRGPVLPLFAASRGYPCWLTGS